MPDTPKSNGDHSLHYLKEVDVVTSFPSKEEPLPLCQTSLLHPPILSLSQICLAFRRHTPHPFIRHGATRSLTLIARPTPPPRTTIESPTRPSKDSGLPAQTIHKILWRHVVVEILGRIAARRPDESIAVFTPITAGSQVIKLTADACVVLGAVGTDFDGLFFGIGFQLGERKR